MILLSLLLGFLFGVVSGLLPGLHPNNIIPIVLTLSFLFNPLDISVILISAGVINSFVNFIPSIIFGAPDDSNVLSVLPGHKLLLQGKGLEAIKVSVTGSLGGVFFALLILPLFVLIFPKIYLLIRPYLYFILSAVSLYMIVTEKGFKKVLALIVFILSGLLGFFVLNSSDKYLLPLLSGLFALPGLFLAFRNKVKIPPIGNSEDKVKFDLKSIVVGGLGGILAGLLPGIGAAQSTAIVNQIFRKSGDEKTFLSSIGSLTSSDFIYSILALWIIGNARSGIAVAIGNILEINFQYVLVFITVIVLSSIFGYFLTLIISKKLIPKLIKINYSFVSIAIMIFIIFLVFVFSGIVGLLVTFVSSLIGLVAVKSGIKRSICMACLILPTIIFFAGL
jgi:putative membrane protein